MKSNLKKITIGVMSLEAYKKRTIAIAKGEYKPKKDEPKVWFTSMKSMAHVLSEENQHLLKLIIERKPQSISDLEPLTGRKANNILRTLRTMEHYGFVSFEERKTNNSGRNPLIPKVIYDTADVKLDFVCHF
jgi:predicted transcriptional regulator